MTVLSQIQSKLRLEVRRRLVEREQRGDPRLHPWPQVAAAEQEDSYRSVCNVCGWHGERFGGFVHCESATCPSCGSIGRDRFLYHCWVQRTTYRPDEVVLETSPRLGAAYRDRMKSLVDYRSSDFDLRAHEAEIQVDLQSIDLPDASLDTVLTPHVLEHVPDYEKALGELHRVVRPGGVVFLQVPIQQGATAPPTEPEFHEDRTPVFWRFGFDLADDLRSAGFATTVLVTGELKRRVDATDRAWADQNVTPDFDTPSIVAAARPEDLTVVSSERHSRRLGFEPAFMYCTFEARRP